MRKKHATEEERREAASAASLRWHYRNRAKVNAAKKAKWAAMTVEERIVRAAYYRDRDLQRNFGLTSAQWDVLFFAQGRKCACCYSFEPGSKKGWHVDHCHTTGKIRGILCQRCNLALAHSKEDIVRLQALIEYLRKSLGDGDGCSV